MQTQDKSAYSALYVCGDVTDKSGNFPISSHTPIALLCMGVLSALAPHAKADDWDQKTIFTFNEPVEIPG